MNLDDVSLEDCLLQYEVNNQITIINDGHITGFEDDTSISLYVAYFIKDKKYFIANRLLRL